MRRASEETMHGAERRRQQELQDLVEWVAERKNQNKEEQRLAVEAAKAKAQRAAKLVQDWQRVKDAVAPPPAPAAAAPAKAPGA